MDNAAQLDWRQEYDLLYATSGIAAQYQGEDYLDVAEYFAASGVCEHCLEGSPGFVDQAAGDYILNAGSPAVDQAILIPGINSLDSNGNLPDMGAKQVMESIQIVLFMSIFYILQPSPPAGEQLF